MTDTHLVVANQTLGGRELMRVIDNRVGAGAEHFLVVVPLTPADDYAPDWSVPLDPGLQPPAVDPASAAGMQATDRALEDAEQRLEVMLRRIRATGARAEGRLGDSDPMVAIDAALEAPPEIVEIILSTLPASISRWMGMDLPSRLRRRTDLPVTTVEATEDGSRSD